MDRRIERSSQALPDRLRAADPVRYVNNAGIESPAIRSRQGMILPHFFNHQTHHRAQVHTLLSQLGHPSTGARPARDAAVAQPG